MKFEHIKNALIYLAFGGTRKLHCRQHLDYTLENYFYRFLQSIISGREVGSIYWCEQKGHYERRFHNEVSGGVT